MYRSWFSATSPHSGTRRLYVVPPISDCNFGSRELRFLPPGADSAALARELGPQGALASRLPIVGNYGGRLAGGSHLRQSAALGAWSFACALLCKRVLEIGGSLRESLEAIGGDMARGRQHDRRERCVMVFFAASSEARPALLTDQAVPKILQATLQSLPVLVDDISHDRSSNG